MSTARDLVEELFLSHLNDTDKLLEKDAKRKLLQTGLYKELETFSNFLRGTGIDYLTHKECEELNKELLAIRAKLENYRARGQKKPGEVTISTLLSEHVRKPVGVR